ncbi:6-phospho-beta-glucosidase [Nakamurella flavida]|uniref:6-phospho-beta-glucosidase n=1 Tax=Nakamurella flavida TaxID=363630 RepID=A0A939C6H5_9ACTN|nr:6-phospho-beta-glucosidase [Nakamurella flavida]MBM9478079.1 6-phospho-beta-glucosidase [Nakamurella flavida]MDP9778700.1 6-phospho-beta-glucosidase [Nakamurella flavida]
MKLCILGGGGFRTPYVWQALVRDHGDPRVTEVALYDIDGARLATMERILRQFAEDFPDAPKLVCTTDLREALTGSRFVFAALRVGGVEGRRCDEHVALDLGVIGQETTGPGGLAYALRTIGPMLDIARIIAEVAPEAYLMNFTNPAGIITEALQSVLGDRVLGICDTPSGLGRRVAGVLGYDHTRVQMDYVGLNHLGWMRRLMVDGQDVLPELLADDAALSRMEETQVFGMDWMRTLGVVPNEYLYYYSFNRDAVGKIVDSAQTRGDFLAVTQGEFFRDAAASQDPAALWAQAVENRSASYMAEARGGEQGKPTYDRDRETDPSHQGYAGVALGVMAAISRNERQTMILNVRNRGTIAGLPDDAVVEVPTMVDANGVHPLSTDQPELYQIGLMQSVKAVERLTIEAATTGSREAALKAFALHPLVDSVTVARQLLDGYIAQIPGVADALRN